jgi:hypothetical protein
MSRKAVNERKDTAEMEVESVSEEGHVILRFFGGIRLAFDAHPELAHFYRRLVSPALVEND